jgi:hypothetical protein
MRRFQGRYYGIRQMGTRDFELVVMSGGLSFDAILLQVPRARVR